MFKFKNVLVGIGVCALALNLSIGHVSASGNSVVTVNASNVNMRSGPGTSNKVVGLLQTGNKITVLSQSGDWYKVNAFGVIGWIKSSFISSSASSTSSKTSTSSAATVNASNVNMRSGPGTSNKVVGLLQTGNKITILSQSGDWYKVNASGAVGWIKSNFVSQGNASRNASQPLASRGETTRANSESDDIIGYAKTLLGVRYVWGGNSPNGFDCSGFTKYVFQHFGVTLNRVAADQANQGAQVSRSDLRAGDLVFFDTDGGHNYINHSGIYIGNGMFIQESSGAGKVVISSLSEGFYANAYMTARRVIN